MIKEKYDYLIVGAGLFGAVFARQALDSGKSVLVAEKRDHIGGNVYTESINGINVHVYGAHIFHTDDREVWDYVNRFARFSDYIHTPKANYRGEIYDLPFNMNTFRKMWNVTEPAEAAEIIDGQRKEYTAMLRGRDPANADAESPRNLEEQAISMAGRDIYEKLIKGYTQKQWGRPCTELPAFIIKRIPLRFEYNNNYFDDRYQGIPEGGYTKMVEKLLSGADVMTGTDYLKEREKLEGLADHTVYTGPLDAYFGFRLGNLEYRSLRFETEILDIPDFQDFSVVNYTDAETPWTRIIEHKWFEAQKGGEKGTEPAGTVITREYSKEWQPGDEPYYPVNDEKNDALYARYRELAEKEENVIFGGRLAEYRYYDMDDTVRHALDAAKAEFC